MLCRCFGASSSASAPAPSFGGSAPAPSGGGFAGFGDSSKKASFGGGGGDSKAPAFGAAADSSKPPAAFGAAPADSAKPPAFGAAAAPAFGAAPADSAKPPAFGAAPATDSAKPPAFGAAPAAGAPSFGAAAPAADSTKPPAFGAAPAPAASGDDSAAKKPAFSFPGGSAKPADTPAFGATPSKPAEGAGGGFSFAGAKTPAPATPGAPPTPATPAPVSTPAAPKTNTTTTPAPEPPRLDYQALTVEQTLNKFQKELEKDAVEFLDEAKRIAEYDAILRDAQRDISNLTQQTHRIVIQEEEVEKTLGIILGFQDELDQTLADVENMVDELFNTSSQGLPVDADVEREKAYATAQSVEERLQTLTAELDATMKEMDGLQENMLDGDAGKIVQIFSQHEMKLAEVQAAGRQLDQDLAHVQKMLGQMR